MDLAVGRDRAMPVAGSDCVNGRGRNGGGEAADDGSSKLTLPPSWRTSVLRTAAGAIHLAHDDLQLSPAVPKRRATGSAVAIMIAAESKTWTHTSQLTPNQTHTEVDRELLADCAATASRLTICVASLRAVGLSQVVA